MQYNIAPESGNGILNECARNQKPPVISNCAAMLNQPVDNKIRRFRHADGFQNVKYSAVDLCHLGIIERLVETTGYPRPDNRLGST